MDPYKTALDTNNRMVRAYNAGDWDGVIKEAESFHIPSYSINMYPNTRCAGLLEGIARANRDNDYQSAFESISKGVPHGDDDNAKILRPAAEEAGKKAFERAHGRAMTDADHTQVHIVYLEKRIAEYLKKAGNPEDYYYKDNIKNCWEWVGYWEYTTKRKMTKEDQIRIYGKPFPGGKRGLFGGLFGKK